MRITVQGPPRLPPAWHFCAREGRFLPADRRGAGGRDFSWSGKTGHLSDRTGFRRDV